jgi:hypothetical protein
MRAGRDMHVVRYTVFGGANIGLSTLLQATLDKPPELFRQALHSRSLDWFFNHQPPSSHCKSERGKFALHPCGLSACPMWEIETKPAPRNIKPPRDALIISSSSCNTAENSVPFLMCTSLLLEAILEHDKMQHFRFVPWYN